MKYVFYAVKSNQSLHISHSNSQSKLFSTCLKEQDSEGGETRKAVLRVTTPGGDSELAADAGFL